MDTLSNDVRYALRRLLKSPGFAAVVILTLGLGIGANSAIFSVVNAVVFRSLPYPKPDRLVRLFQVGDDGGMSTFTPMNYLDAQAGMHALESSAAYTGAGFTLTSDGEPERLEGAEASASFFDVLGVRPALGRGFLPDENQPGRTHVAVISHSLWTRRFNADRAVIGRSIVLNSEPHTVIGVMPEGFAYPTKREVWTPLEYDTDFTQKSRGAWYLSIIGRLKPAATVEQAATEIAAIGRRLETEFPETNLNVKMTVVGLHSYLTGDIKPKLLVLLAAVGFVLLIACANVANLLLARAAAREGEIALRAALGAGRGRLMQQLLTESVVLAIGGGLLGLLLAVLGTKLLLSLQPAGIPRLEVVRVDGAVIAFTAFIALATGIVFGMIPAFQATRGDLVSSLKEGGKGALASRRAGRMREVLVVTEIALAVMLLAGAGLLMRSFARLQSVNPGFRAAQSLTFRTALPAAAYRGEPERASFYQRALERVTALPGVTSAGAISALPLSGSSFGFTFEIEGDAPPRPGEEPAMQTRVVTPDFFKAMGVPLLRGRGFTAADNANSQQVVLLSEAAVKRYFPNSNPIGRRITLGWGRGPGRLANGGEVVGIVGSVKQFGLDEAEQPEIYIPHAQTPMGGMSFVVHTAVEPTTLADAVRRELRSLDPSLPVTALEPLEAVVARSISQPRFYMLVLGIFAAVALVLASIGIFGVVSYAVSQRTREMGIRIALGASRERVLRMVLGNAMRLALAGVVVGLLASIALSRTLASLLFDLSPTDPMTFAAVGIGLSVVALLASYLPAWRATRVDPVVALRAD
jgi:putative ABC transport system permease protein